MAVIHRHPNLTKFNSMAYNQYWIYFTPPYDVYAYIQFSQPLDTPQGIGSLNQSFVSRPNLNLQNVVISYPFVTQQTVSPFLFIM